METDRAKRILIVDASFTTRLRLRMILEAYVACRVTEAPDGITALDLVRGGGFDLVLTDINVPRLDGLGLVKAVRRELRSAVPIVVIVNDERREGDQVTACGADASLAKPISSSRVTSVAGLFLGEGLAEIPARDRAG